MFVRLWVLDFSLSQSQNENLLCNVCIQHWLIWIDCHCCWSGIFVCYKMNSISFLPNRNSGIEESTGRKKWRLSTFSPEQRLWLSVWMNANTIHVTIYQYIKTFNRRHIQNSRRICLRVCVGKCARARHLFQSHLLIYSLLGWLYSFFLCVLNAFLLPCSPNSVVNTWN